MIMDMQRNKHKLQANLEKHTPVVGLTQPSTAGGQRRGYS